MAKQLPVGRWAGTRASPVRPRANLQVAPEHRPAVPIPRSSDELAADACAIRLASRRFRRMSMTTSTQSVPARTCWSGPVVSVVDPIGGTQVRARVPGASAPTNARLADMRWLESTCSERRRWLQQFWRRVLRQRGHCSRPWPATLSCSMRCRPSTVRRHRGHDAGRR